MNKDNDFTQIEALLSGRIKQPSPRFEEALRQIPLRATRPVYPSTWSSLLKFAGVAAILSLFVWTGLDLDVSNRVPSAENILQDDTDLLTLFSLSNDLDMADTLLSEDNLLALDYLISSP